MSKWVLVAGCVLSLFASMSAANADAGKDAYYVVSPAGEGQVAPVSRLRLHVADQESTGGRSMVWWEFTATLTGSNDRFGVRVLSERAPMTSQDGIGQVKRYIYRDAKGSVLEYIDATTGQALLPRRQFDEVFLPRPSPDARYEQGCASAGIFLGHVLMRVPRIDGCEPVTFDSPRALSLRTDLLMGSQSSTRPHGPMPADKTKRVKEDPFTRSDYEEMIAAGMNYFGFPSPQPDWIVEQPVFLYGRGTFPDAFYRSNFLTTQMFIDEPSVRMGWGGGLPHHALGPEQVAQALYGRVASQLTLARRAIKLERDDSMGTVDLIDPLFESWETDYFSAWYQFRAGVSGLVHEGRYSAHDYGWTPRDLFGQEGLEAIRFEEQVHCVNAIMRGAARAFDRDWGVSVYPEGEPGLRQPALNMAYDMGARHIWFWTDSPNMGYDVQLELLKGLKEHIKEHPRGNLRAVNHSAKLGIALPPGYSFAWNGTWGVEREQLSPGGASYGDISAAMIWEGICASLRGENFDFLIDEPVISSLGYDRLVRVQTDGSLKVTPAWPCPGAVRGLKLTLADDTEEDVSSRLKHATTDYAVPRAASVSVDGKLTEWNDTKWISLDAAHDGFPDGVTIKTVLTNDVSRDDWRISFRHGFGMNWSQVNSEFEKKYRLEDLHDRRIGITKVEPGSPAAKAGILEGDVIIAWNSLNMYYEFQMFERLGHFAKSKGGEKIPFTLRRSGQFRFGAPGDLAAQIAMALDDKNLYLAARVTDDQHWQPNFGWEFWKGDSLQIGFDPTMERRADGYGEENQEFGFILQDDKSIVWRYAGRRGQPLGESKSVKAKIVRGKGETRYEAAIPLSDLAPMAPDLWPACGMNVVINDSDGQMQRKGRLELRPRAMTGGKHPKDFATLVFAPSSDDHKVSAAIRWRRRVTPENGFFRVVMAACSPKAAAARIEAELSSLDSPETPSVKTSMALPLSPKPRQHSMAVHTDSPPGRYRLNISVISSDDKVAAADALCVYVYPKSAKGSSKSNNQAGEYASVDR